MTLADKMLQMCQTGKRLSMNFTSIANTFKSFLTNKQSNRHVHD